MKKIKSTQVWNKESELDVFFISLLLSNSKQILRNFNRATHQTFQVS